MTLLAAEISGIEATVHDATPVAVPPLWKAPFTRFTHVTKFGVSLSVHVPAKVVSGVTEVVRLLPPFGAVIVTTGGVVSPGELFAADQSSLRAFAPD